MLIAIMTALGVDNYNMGDIYSLPTWLEKALLEQINQIQMTIILSRCYVGLVPRWTSEVIF
ncbi:MAG: hypothetical protein A2Y40_01635 [Candidatus Margulisbacteria bacterium GWF2_35_9]|nr:MAG: hypothetical protein A2Y40_01635 [Candidatus Margulisbacteria bacterium GWF2_35_9]